MNGEPIHVLIIDDEKRHAEAIAESLERVGYECVIATSGAQGAKRIEEDDYDVILTDLRMEGTDGLAILRKAKQSLPDSEVVVITGYGDVKTAVSARTMAIDPESGRIYLVAADLDPTAPAPTSGRNMKIIPGSFRLMFLDPR